MLLAEVLAARSSSPNIVQRHGRGVYMVEENARYDTKRAK